MSAGSAAQQSPRTKGARRRRRIFLAIVCGFAVWAVLTFWEQSGTMTEKREELKTLQVEFDKVRSQNEQYRMEVTRLNDSEYIEQRVRKDYGMIRPGDKVFQSPAE